MSTNSFIATAILAWGLGAIFTKIATNHLHPLMMASITVFIYIIFIPIALLVFKIPFQVNGTGFVFAIISSIAMGIGSLAYFFALQKGDAGGVTAAISVYPVLTVIASILFLNEELSLKKIMGCILAAVAIFLITQK